ncbi:MAG TPA: HAMP domain-containing sensor histidine kinase [Sphingobium sp.]|nr:HAMP domain-containing sensor histidine kinase [Sphingobium sp.]
MLYLTVRREVAIAADHQLATASQLLYTLMQEELAAGVAAPKAKPQHITEPLLSQEDRQAFRAASDARMFAIFRDGVAIARSQQGPPTSAIPRQRGFRDFPAPDGIWRSYGLMIPRHDLLIVVAERHSVRDLALTPVVRRLTLPFLLLLAGGAALLWFAMRRGVSEIHRLGADLTERTVQDLTALDETRWPRDLAPLIQSLNKLFARLEQAFDLEQAFTDDVAHQLRTPLAAIRIQAQMIRNTAPPDLHGDINQLIALADRTNRLIGGMLTLARLNATAVQREIIDLHPVIADIVAEQMTGMLPERMAFSVRPEASVNWTTDTALLKIALAAIIENAATHARSGGRVDIHLDRTETALAITIRDCGPGVPLQDRTRLLRRFERGSPNVPGSGLGLSIAARAVAILGGEIFLGEHPDGPGLVVILRLFAAPEK